MRNRVIRFSEGILTAVLLIIICTEVTGCNRFSTGEMTGRLAKRLRPYVTVSAEEASEPGKQIHGRQHSEENISAAAVSGQPEAVSENAVMSISSCYAYSTLSDDEKKVYSEIYSTIDSMGSEVKLSTTDPDRADKCFNCVMLDHPEFFFLDGYRTTSYTLAGRVTSLAFTGKYTMTDAERRQKEALINNYVNQCLAGVPSGGDDYARVRYIYDYIITNTDYEAGSEDSQNICSVFINHKSVCQGYTMATKYLLDKLGIMCTVVYGSANGGSHAWNLVKMDGVYCYVDTTWGDASYRSANDGSSFNRTNYSYLGADWDILSRTHTIESIIALPECNSLDEYYFVREGLYFESADMNRLKQVFRDAYGSGEDTLTIKCADSDVYMVMKTELFTDGKIFDMLQSGGKAKYVTDDEELTISFSL